MSIRIRIVYIAAILAAILFLIGVTSARADGCESVKDCDYAYSAPRTSRRVSDDTPHRLRAYLSSQELRTLRSIKARAEARRMARSGPVIPPPYYRSRKPPRYAEARRSRYDSEPVSSRQCQPSISVEGEERGSESRARGNARDTWQRVAISKHGYRFGDFQSARGTSFSCTRLRSNKLGWPIYSCGLTARPCRD